MNYEFNIKNMKIIKTESFIEAKNSLNTIEEALLSQEPHKAYILANALAKIGKKVQDKFKDDFEKYWNNNKNLPGGFDARESNRVSYAFEEDPEWAMLDAQKSEREQKLKNAWILSDKGQTYSDANWEIIPLVKRTFTPIISLTQK